MELVNTISIGVRPEEVLYQASYNKTHDGIVSGYSADFECEDF